jgi:cation diffusion facilitator CzcD-associated flavoprotein CzcO
MSASKNGTPETLDALIIGAGFSGLYALYRFRDVLGLRARVYETGDGVGGTWYWNRYPGARCDSESYVYSYSFSEELEQEWDWTSKYPEQPEILRYLDYVADRFDLRRDIQLETRITKAHFDDTSALWNVETEHGERLVARFLVTAVGCLSATNLPDIPGLDRFEGDWFHTSRWPHEGVDFRGKRVGLIGTGSTGIQATPVIAAEADHLTVFQRTPNYTVRFPYTPVARSALDFSEEERNEIFEQLWEEGGFKFMWGSFGDIIRNKDANDLASDFIRKKIRETVKDPEVAELLCPTDHPYGSKRPPIDTDYYETFNRDNVKLVDIRNAPIVEITPDGVRTETDHYELDIIVFATGFDAMTGSLLRIDIRGAGGLRLADKWKEGPRSYLGLGIAGFPNLFTITGPGSPSVLMNMPVAIEQHVDWISDCIEFMADKGVSRIEPKEDAEDAWVEHVAEVSKETLMHEANSWYLGANIPGKTRVVMPYTGGQLMYRAACDAVVEKGYEGFELSA